MFYNEELMTSQMFPLTKFADITSTILYIYIYYRCLNKENNLRMLKITACYNTTTNIPYANFNFYVQRKLIIVMFHHIYALKHNLHIGIIYVIKRTITHIYGEQL